MSTLVAGMAAFVAADTGWTYDPAAVIPDGVTPLGVASLPEGFDTAAAVTTYPGGPEPDSANGWEYPRMQVRVRALNPLDALQLDRDAYEALQAAGPVILPGGVWRLQDCYALQSEAQPLGQDANGRWEFVRNYQLSAELV